MKVNNKTFKAVFSRSKFSTEEEYIEHCKKMEELRDINVPTNGSLSQFNNFLKHYIIRDYNDLTNDFKNYCREDEIIQDCGIDLKYKGVIKRNISRYYPEKDLREYCISFKEMLDLEDYVKSEYNKEYSNFYKQVFRYIKNGDIKKNYEYRFIYIPDLANSILEKDLSQSEIHNILSGYGQVKDHFGSVEEYLYHLKDCHDFKEELERRNLVCNNDIVRRWKDAGKPSIDDWLENKKSSNFDFSDDDISSMIENGREVSDYSGPGVYIRYIGDVPVDVCETSSVEKEIENFYFIYNNVLLWIKGMNYEDIEKFHKESCYNIKKYICYNQYKGEIRNILVSDSKDRNEREAIEFLVAKKINARYFCSVKLNYIPFYDYKDALKKIYKPAIFISHNTQRPSGNVISSDLKNNIQMTTLLGGFGTSESTLCFDEDISDFCKPEIKGRGFVKTGNDIYEYQSFWIPDPKYILKDKDFEGTTPVSERVAIEDVSGSPTEENIPVNSDETSETNNNNSNSENSNSEKRLSKDELREKRRAARRKKAEEKEQKKEEEFDKMIEKEASGEDFTEIKRPEKEVWDAEDFFESDDEDETEKSVKEQDNFDREDEEPLRKKEARKNDIVRDNPFDDEDEKEKPRKKPRRDHDDNYFEDEESISHKKHPRRNYNDEDFEDEEDNFRSRKGYDRDDFDEEEPKRKPQRSYEVDDDDEDFEVFEEPVRPKIKINLNRPKPQEDSESEYFNDNEDNSNSGKKTIKIERTIKINLKRD